MDPIVRNGNSLKWKFENIKDLTEKNVFSEKFTIDPIDWKLYIRTQTLNDEKYVAPFLCCVTFEERKNWICEFDAKLKFIKQGGDGEHLIAELKNCYHRDGFQSWGFSPLLLWSDVLEEENGYIIDGSLLVECEFDFKYYDFSKTVPNFTDIILNVKDTEFHLNRFVLCARSKYFYDLILKNKPNELKTIKLDDVKAQNFCYMLASFYPFFETNLESRYQDLIKLATQFGVPSLHHKCEEYLIGDTKIRTIDKIKYADDNDYVKLMKTCIESLKSGVEVKILQNDPKFSELKDITKLRIMRRCLDFF